MERGFSSSHPCHLLTLLNRFTPRPDLDLLQSYFDRLLPAMSAGCPRFWYFLPHIFFNLPTEERGHCVPTLSLAAVVLKAAVALAVQCYYRRAVASCASAWLARSDEAMVVVTLQ
jgi:hypothetical protein